MPEISLQSPKFGRPHAVPDGSAHRYAVERRARARAPQHQSAAAHVAAANECGGEVESFPKDIEERTHVLVGRDTTKQHDAVIGANPSL